MRNVLSILVFGLVIFFSSCSKTEPVSIKATLPALYLEGKDSTILCEGPVYETIPVAGKRCDGTPYTRFKTVRGNGLGVYSATSVKTEGTELSQDSLISLLTGAGIIPVTSDATKSSFGNAPWEWLLWVLGLGLIFWLLYWLFNQIQRGNHLLPAAPIAPTTPPTPSPEGTWVPKGSNLTTGGMVLLPADLVRDFLQNGNYFNRKAGEGMQVDIYSNNPPKEETVAPKAQENPPASPKGGVI